MLLVTRYKVHILGLTWNPDFNFMENAKEPQTQITWSSKNKSSRHDWLLKDFHIDHYIINISETSFVYPVKLNKKSSFVSVDMF